MAADSGLLGALIDIGEKIAVPIVNAKNNAAIAQKNYEVDLQKARADALATQLQSQVNTTATLQNWYNTNSGVLTRVMYILLSTMAVGVLSYIFFSFNGRRRRA